MKIEDLVKKIELSLVDQIKSLQEMTVENFITFVEQFQLEIVRTLGLSSVTIRKLDAEALKNFLSIILRGEGGQLYFRHGEQDPGSEVALLEDFHKKVVMMQEEHNTNDPITQNSAIEFIGTLMTIAFFKEKLAYEVEVNSSVNRRALIPAIQLEKVLGCPLNTSPVWNCINYPKTELLDIKQLDGKGNLKWESEKVDKVVGAGTFDRITGEMKKELTKPIKNKTIQIAVTHTQQLDAIYKELSGSLSSVPLANYGFVYRDKKGMVLRCESGFYSTQKLVLEREPSHGSLPLVGSVFDAPSNTVVGKTDQKLGPKI